MVALGLIFGQLMILKSNGFARLQGQSINKGEHRGFMIIDWFYFRRSWTSCQKAQEVLDVNNFQVVQYSYSNKEKIDGDSAWDLIHEALRVYVAKGNKIEVFIPERTDRSVILMALLGRGGNLRAPTLRIGQIFCVGYNKGLYQMVSEGSLNMTAES